MKILLEAFVDNNFGDNLFLHIVTAKNPEHSFYMLEKAAYAASYRIIEKEIPNLVVCKDESFLKEMEGMCIVGGDLFWDKGDYSELIRHAHAVKKQGGRVAILGFSLFPKYSLRTWFDLAVLFAHADQIVVREETSYQQLKKHLPWISAVSATDLAFTTDVREVKQEAVQKGLLGVSIRKKIQKDSDVQYPKYCRAVADLIEEYLGESEEHQVNFLALSSGVYDDRKAAEDIRALCREEFQTRMLCTSFEGNVEKYLREIQKCEKLICTRFHALVFAILLEKEFFPIIYEEKMDRLLDALDYKENRVRYEDAAKNTLNFHVCSGDALNRYLQKAELFSTELKLKKTGNKGFSGLFYVLYQLKELLLRQLYRRLFGRNGKSE